MSLKRKKRVLAIDDEPAMTEWLKILLEHAGYEVRTALIGTRGEELFKTWRPDAVITDMMLPDVDGIELVRKFKQLDPEAEVIVITGQGNIPRSVEAVKAGAFDFLEKPVDAERLLDKLEKAIKQKALIDENEQLKAKLQDRYKFQNVIGKSKKMQELFELIESVAASEANILIQGENGTGKELIANAIHYNSKRSKGPFIKINCAAIPKDLIESELFGYKKGAFTGATMDKEGLFEMAEGGSLLLDEIGEMPPYLQTKLLRVLQEREYRPIGSDRIVHARQVPSALPEERQDAGAVGLSPVDPQPLARERPRAGKRDRARGAGRQGLRNRGHRSARIDSRGIDNGHRFRDSAASDARRDREDGHPADAAAHQLEQAGSRADPGPVSPHAVQQDEEARHPRRRQVRPQRVGVRGHAGRDVRLARAICRRRREPAGKHSPTRE